jgi:RNA polymerase sigma factor (TIGR02999 family)
MDSGPHLTELIEGLRTGDGQAWDRLLPIVYEELRLIASRQLRHQNGEPTLNTTALVHEAYIKLAEASRLGFVDRAHFFALAARAMRQIVIDHARRHQAAKRGGEWRRVPLDEAEIPLETRAETLLALDEALNRLSEMNDRLARVVECRFFGGMTEQETAAALGVNERTVRRDWTKARLWLYAEIRPGAA